MKILTGYVIVFKDNNKVSASSDLIATTVDLYPKLEDAQFLARTTHKGRPLEIRRAELKVL